MPILFSGSPQWATRDIVVSFQNCLKSTDKIKVYRGFKKSSSIDVVLKIIQINYNLLTEYQRIVRNAELLYSKEKRTENFIIPFSQVTGYICNQNIPQGSKDKQYHLYLIRPYFLGNNFHESVYVNERVPFEKQQFHQFIKQSISLFSKISYIQALQPTFLPTLENVYFDGVGLNANLLSTQTLMFLKGNMAHLSVENFKHLFLLLQSDPEIFVNWEKMKFYMAEEMLCRAILIMWICMMTLRSPIEMLWQTTVNDQELEWNHLIDNFMGSETNKRTDKKKINPNNKIIGLIRDSPRLWREFLNKPQNIACFELFSQYIFENIQQRVQLFEKDQTYTKDKQQQKKYFYNLFYKVFVKEEQFGWKEFFRLNDVFLYLQQVELNPDQIKIGKIMKENEKFDIIKQFTNRKNTKINAIHQAFIYVHKYFLYKDIIEMKLTKQKAQTYAKRLRFETYVPFKIGLSIENILHYGNWFEVFFVEKQDCRGQVYQAANFLFDMLDKESGAMLESVTFAEFYHIKRVLYLLGMKIAEDREEKQTYKGLKDEIKMFISKHRPHQTVLNSLRSNLRQISQSQNQKPHFRQVQLHYMKQLTEDKDEDYIDLVIPMLVYLCRQEENTKSSISNTANQDWQSTKEIFSEKANKAFQTYKIRKQQDSRYIGYRQDVPIILSKRLQLKINQY